MYKTTYFFITLCSLFLLSAQSFANNYSDSAFDRQYRGGSSNSNINGKYGSNYIFEVGYGQLSPSDLDIKKALLHALFHYNWEIVNHQQKNIVVKYRSTVIEIKIEKSSLHAINKTPSQEINPGWMENLQALFLRQLNYLAEVKKAEKMIDQ